MTTPPLQSQCLHDALAGSIWCQRVLFFEQLGSTNDEALRLWQSGEGRAGDLVITRHQTSGRGQRGRQWASPADRGLYFTLLLSAEKAPQPLSLAAGLALHSTLNAVGVAQWLKWPNDIYAGRRKLGGILVESTANPSGERAFALGIGLNVRPLDSTHPISDSATSLETEASGRFLPPLAELVRNIVDAIPQKSENDVVEWIRRDKVMLGAQYLVEEKGEKPTWYRAIALQDEGFLVVQDDRGQEQRWIASGDRRVIDVQPPD